MKYQECYRRGKDVLSRAGIEEAALDARLLLEYICGTDRNALLVHGEREVEDSRKNLYFQCIEKRAERVPLQHITGIQNFMGLDFQVNSHVLIPRQDTEILVEEVLRELTDGSTILDMCTGSGCILISLLKYSNWCHGVGVDISSEALAVAVHNAGVLLEAKGISAAECMAENRTSQCTYSFIESDLFEKVKGRFDIIVSNPPYIRTDVIETLMPEVKDHEPRQALDGTADGLYFYRRISEESVKYLNAGGMLYFEIGFDQAHDVEMLMRAAGYTDVRSVKDYAGHDRVVCGRLHIK